MDKKKIPSPQWKRGERPNNTVPRIVCVTVHTHTHTHTHTHKHMKNSTVLLFKEREIEATMHLHLLQKYMGGAVATMTGQRSVMAISTLLVGVLIKTSFLENNLQYIHRALKYHLSCPSSFTCKHPS